MKIENLTAEQVEMLDFMWNELDTEQDYLEWYECLDSGQRQQADLLQRLVILESFEEMLDQGNYPDAKRVIQSIIDKI
jgi:hypothetical protein